MTRFTRILLSAILFAAIAGAVESQALETSAAVAESLSNLESGKAALESRLGVEMVPEGVKSQNF